MTMKIPSVKVQVQPGTAVSVTRRKSNTSSSVLLTVNKDTAVTIDDGQPAPAPPPVPLATVAALGWLGGNQEMFTSYFGACWYSDVVKHSRGFFALSTNAALTAANGGLDADGYPNQDFSLGVSSLEANAPPGVYSGTITGKTAAPVVSARSSVSNITQSSSGKTTTFTCTIEPGNVALNFTGCDGCTDLHEYRPGLDATSTVHNPAAINFFKQFSGQRFMKPLRIENDTALGKWTGPVASGGRPTPQSIKAGAGGEDMSELCMSWEDLVDMCNALAAAPASNFKWAHINFHHTHDDAFITEALKFIHDRAIGDWYVSCEYTNEPWGFTYPCYYAERETARIETDTLLNGAPIHAQIASASSDGAGTITVNTAQPLVGKWASRRQIDGRLGDLVVRDVTATPSGSSQFKFAATAPVGAINVAGSIFVGDRTNPLNFDGAISLGVFAVRYHARRTREIALIGERVFGVLNGRFRMMLCYQQQAATNNGTMNMMLEYLASQFQDRKPRTYLYSGAIAPYVEPADQPDNVDALLIAMQASMASVLRNAQTTFEVLSYYGLRSETYEGGPSTLLQTTPSVATVIAAYQDPRMRALQSDLWKGLWARGFGKCCYMDLGISKMAYIPKTGGKQWFHIAESLDDVPTQKLLGMQDCLAFVPGPPTISNYPIPGTHDGMTYTKLPYSGFSGPLYTYNQNPSLRAVGCDFGAVSPEERAKPHPIGRGGCICVETGDCTIALKVYLTGTGTVPLGIDIEDVETGAARTYTYNAAPNTVVPLSFQAPIPAGPFVRGRKYNYTITVPAGCSRSIAVGDVDFKKVQT